MQKALNQANGQSQDRPGAQAPDQLGQAVASLALTLTTCQRDVSDLRSADQHLANTVVQLVNGYNRLISELQAKGVIEKPEEGVPQAPAA